MPHSARAHLLPLCPQIVVRRFDKNNDGLISFHEFVQHMVKLAGKNTKVDEAERILQRWGDEIIDKVRCRS